MFWAIMTPILIENHGGSQYGPALNLHPDIVAGARGSGRSSSTGHASN